MSFPTFIIKSIIVSAITVKIYVKPIFVYRVYFFLLYIFKSPKISANMIKNTIYYYFYIVFV